LKKVEERTCILRRFAACFTDYRTADRVEHPLVDLVAQRVYGLALGYEDLNDHDELRRDPMLAVILGKDGPQGPRRRRVRDRGKAWAGKSTLNRLELTLADFDPDHPWPTSPVPGGGENQGEETPAQVPPRQYKKMVMDPASLERLLVDVFLEAHAEAPQRIILDLDATDDPLHGNQEGRFFHGYYKGYCYLPLYIFCGEHLSRARLQMANLDASADSVPEVARIVAHIRAYWPAVQMVLRADSGFCGEALMAWGESQGVHYVFGVAQNTRWNREIETELAEAAQIYEPTRQAARVFKEFLYKTKDRWSRERGGQGGALGPRRPSAFCGDLAVGRGMAGADLVRGSLLRPGRDGEPDQRAAVVSVRRSHEHPQDVVQPAQTVLVFQGAGGAAGVAALGAGGHGDGQGTMPNHPAEAAQDRRAGARDGAQGLDLAGQRLSLRSAVCAADGQSGRGDSAAVLTAANTPKRTRHTRDPASGGAEMCP